jgi:hypothetical protein
MAAAYLAAPALSEDIRFFQAFLDRENAGAVEHPAACLRVPSPLNGEKARMRGG